jgi:hypothetical protein
MQLKEAEEMTGTPAQIEWAERIKRQVDAEFDRMAKALGSLPAKPDADQRAEVATILAILEENRDEVLGNTEAGYFIKHWQELGDQVRKMIVEDSRYLEIRAARVARRS